MHQPPRPVVDPALLNATAATRWANLGWWETDVQDYAIAARALATRVGEAAPLRAGDVVVDVACGYGDSLAHWVTAFGVARVVGVEPDPAVSAAVRARIAAWGLADRITVVTATAETFDLAAHVPDATAIVCVDAAYHFRSRGAWLARIAESASSGTRIGFSDLAVRDAAVSPQATMPPRTDAASAAPRALRWGAARAGIPAANLWALHDIPDTMTAAGYAAVMVTECGGPILDGFRAHARRERGRWWHQPARGGWRALATAWLLGRVRPMLTMVCVGAQVR
ncbi:MAG: SAM-dependent methyltransferase [Gemmatimonadota bacterium]